MRLNNEDQVGIVRSSNGLLLPINTGLETTEVRCQVWDEGSECVGDTARTDQLQRQFRRSTWQFSTADTCLAYIGETRGARNGAGGAQDQLKSA